MGAVKLTYGLWGDLKWTREKESLWWERWSELVLAGKERHKKGRQVSHSQSARRNTKTSKRDQFPFQYQVSAYEIDHVKKVAREGARRWAGNGDL